MTGRIDDVDLYTMKEDGCVLRENGDATLALQFVGVHDTFHNSFIRAKGSALLEHGIDERGLAMVNVGNNGNITNA